jgi:hypothetical protein
VQLVETDANYMILLSLSFFIPFCPVDVENLFICWISCPYVRIMHILFNTAQLRGFLALLLFLYLSLLLINFHEVFWTLIHQKIVVD